MNGVCIWLSPDEKNHGNSQMQEHRFIYTKHSSYLVRLFFIYIQWVKAYCSWVSQLLGFFKSLHSNHITYTAQIRCLPNHVLPNFQKTKRETYNVNYTDRKSWCHSDWQGLRYAKLESCTQEIKLAMKSRIKENAQHKLKKCHIYFPQILTSYVINVIKKYMMAFPILSMKNTHFLVLS